MANIHYQEEGIPMNILADNYKIWINVWIQHNGKKDAPNFAVWMGRYFKFMSKDNNQYIKWYNKYMILTQQVINKMNRSEYKEWAENYKLFVEFFYFSKNIIVPEQTLF
ncbi:hypothetical protein [Acanthamoeba polyphaga mimivirus]|uniref:Uncharacterized protein n=2 Tax=Megamimivirinae TaxID=3044648 RepID=A0A2L2DNL7_MIMIV|nr:hypothetical protein MegaChil _gp0874 [Megavirus chiliensis]AEQ32949.1 hypothetical protein [Megavirus chiliensis]AVG46597.1 hypothetical protein [Acanthamoeba polyphaga mimivirus]AVG47707.1 hypothetical protein [Acanthamoeba polyphaga mimivirus]